MSVQANGREIRCDSAACGATAPIPVGLRPSMGDGTAHIEQIAGWVFEVSDGVSRHYCPECAIPYLQRLDRHAALHRQRLLNGNLLANK